MSDLHTPTQFDAEQMARDDAAAAALIEGAACVFAVALLALLALMAYLTLIY